MSQNTPDIYAQAGVNIALSDLFSAYCGEICRGSYENSRFVRIHDYSKGHFRGPRGYELINLPRGSVQTAGADGTGTKTIIIDAGGVHYTSSANLLGMLGGDITRYGGIPLVFLNDFSVNTLGKDAKDPTFTTAKVVMSGLSADAKDQNYVLFGGETAEMSDCVSSENPDAILKYNWCGVMIGALHPDKLIRGEGLRHGDRIIALRDNLRSNGASAIRKGARQRYGKEWFKNEEAKAYIQDAAIPAKLYDKFLVHMNGWTTEGFQPIVKARLIAHLSGGGIQSKFGDDLLFPRGFSAKLHRLWDVPKSVLECAKILGIPDEKGYEIFNGGQGALVVIDEEDVETFLKEAEFFGIEACDAGWIECPNPGATPQIEILSGFTGEKIVLTPKDS